MRTVPVTLVVPCFGRANETKDLLDSLRRSAARCEIVVVDDATPNSLAPLAASYSDLDLRYIRNTSNSGAARSRNVGIDAARHPYIAFTDNDCIVSPDWLDHMLGAIEETPTRIAGIGGRVRAFGSDIFSRYYDYHKTLDPWYFRGRHQYVTTANAIFRRKALLAVGGFDELVLGAGGEDAGLCFKLQSAGYDLGYNPDAVIYHQYRPTLATFMRTFYRYGHGCAGQSRYYAPHPFIDRSGFAGAIAPEDESNS